MVGAREGNGDDRWVKTGRGAREFGKCRRDGPAGRRDWRGGNSGELMEGEAERLGEFGRVDRGINWEREGGGRWVSWDVGLEEGGL